MSVSCRSQYTMESLLENQYVKEGIDAFVKDKYPELYMAAFPNVTDAYPYDQQKVVNLANKMNSVSDKFSAEIKDQVANADLFSKWVK